MAPFALRSQNFSELTSDEIAAARDRNAMVIVPVGAIEQHARHLPVETDVFLCGNVCRLAAARATAVPLLVGPPLPFGFSPHHVSHAGTISLRLGTYLSVLGDVAGSLVASGFKRVVFVNGHGGNSAPLRAKVGELVTDGLPVAAIDYWAPAEREWVRRLTGQLPRAGHACELETALALALNRHRPEEMTRIEEAIAGLAPRTVQPWMGPDATEDPITAAGAAWPPIFQADDCGYFGDPGAATAAVGAELLELIVAGLAEFLDGFARVSLRLGVARNAADPRFSPPLTSR